MFKIKTEYTTKPKRKIQKIVTELLFVLVRIEKKQEIKVNRDFVKSEKNDIISDVRKTNVIKKE